MLSEYEKVMIVKLRHQNQGYKKIARRLNVSRDSVRSFCKAIGLDGEIGIRPVAIPEIIKRCKNCGQEGIGSKFCSTKCRREWWINHPDHKGKGIRARQKYKKICSCCKKEFITEIRNQECCSIICRGELKRTLKNQIRTCTVCGGRYTPTTQDQNCCGASCASVKRTMTLREKADKLREQIGMPVEYHDRRERLGNWRYTKWRKEVYERDKYKCVVCGDSHGNNLNAHHLDCYSQHENTRYDVNNGVTLCLPCHIKFHKVYGYGNNTKTQFIEYLFGGGIYERTQSSPICPSCFEWQSIKN